MLQLTDVAICRHYPMLGPATLVSTTLLTDSTAIWLALSYVVVMGEELVHVYHHLCISLKGSIYWYNEGHRMRNLKLQYNLLKRFAFAFEKHAAGYSFCFAVSCAMV